MGRSLAPLFDTNIVIDYLNGVGDAHTTLAQYDAWAISIVTWIEVMAGTVSTNEAETRFNLASFVCLRVKIEIAERTEVIRRARKLKLPDAIILATAEIEGRLLITRNTRDFEASDSPNPYPLPPLHSRL